MTRILTITRMCWAIGGTAAILYSGGIAAYDPSKNIGTVSAEDSGLFSAAQAARGGEISGAHCAMCHGAELTGGGGSPPLQGPDFLFGWSPKTTTDLVEYISEKMPPGLGHSLTEQQYEDVSAYILSANGFPAGPSPLNPANPKRIGETPEAAQ